MGNNYCSVPDGNLMPCTQPTFRKGFCPRHFILEMERLMKAVNDAVVAHATASTDLENLVQPKPQTERADMSWGLCSVPDGNLMPCTQRAFRKGFCPRHFILEMERLTQVMAEGAASHAAASKDLGFLLTPDPAGHKRGCSTC